LACYKHVLKLGGIPVTKVTVPGFDYAYYDLAEEHQLKKDPLTDRLEADKADGWIRLVADENTRELATISPKKIAMRQKVLAPIMDIRIDKENWVLFYYPTKALAQDADMSEEEFKDFVFSSCLIDYEEQERKQTILKKYLDEGKQVRIVGKNTDLTFSIEGRQGILCVGKRNMPDGEAFIAPVEDSTEGYIAYSYATMKNGQEVSGIRLKFEKGKVVEAKADKGEEFLNEVIKMDPGACKFGEFGIGTNQRIKTSVKQILFDEKIEYTIHLALGRAYKEGNGQNESALHWDMIKDLRDGGRFEIDGKVIQENGKWLIF